MARGGGKPATKQKDRAAASSSTERPGAGEKSTSNEALKRTQQQCLDIYRDAFRPSSEDQTLLQKVKGHLYNRDFAAAFGKNDYLRVYASRWSPSRALAYLQVFRDVEAHLKLAGLTMDAPIGITCIGGGAGGELVGLAAWCSLLREPNSFPGKQLHVTLVDIADWSETTETLIKTITTPPELSKYASQAKRDDNKALLGSDALSVTFRKQDVLDLSQQSEASNLSTFSNSILVTFMFTLNELYSTSTAKAQQLLAHLTQSMSPGSCLQVVDSPGSYSTVSISGTEKKYPMHWLLDHALLGSPADRIEERVGTKWEKLISDDSRWFRLSESLQYPIELEDMRYQIHLYRRRSDVGG